MSRSILVTTDRIEPSSVVTNATELSSKNLVSEPSRVFGCTGVNGAPDRLAYRNVPPPAET